MATVQSYEGFLVARAFLGLAEAGEPFPATIDICMENVR